MTENGIFGNNAGTDRNGEQVFSDLEKLCCSPGYIHALASMCFRDQTVSYGSELLPDDLQHQVSGERLIRTEVATLIGLMVKEKVDLNLPEPKEIDRYIQESIALLHELHQSMILSPEEFFEAASNEAAQGNPFERGDILREAIFYSGESAYNFQYIDFGLIKYANDDDWLAANKGFHLDEAATVINQIEEVVNTKLNTTLRGMTGLPPEQWTMLPGFTFSVQDVVTQTGLNEETIRAVVTAFSIDISATNQHFKSLHDFNEVHAQPLLRIDSDHFVLFLTYSLAAAFYETPFYWMLEDKSYLNQAMENRGDFAEAHSAQRLESVFGSSRVFKNVKIVERKGQTLGEIDVLVIYANRAIILQAKSKRLTIEARRGNDNVIREDFKKGIQDAYDQGWECANHLVAKAGKLLDSQGKEFSIDQELKEVYIFCLVSDHYPALSFQARQFLKYKTSETILPPFVLDVFLLDVLCEMLASQLYFLSYVNRRVQYAERVHSNHELVALAYHLKQNLWLDEETTLLQLADGIAVELDIAMMARRRGVPGQAVPDGILTRLRGCALGELIRSIESHEHAATIDLGFYLLTLDEITIFDVSKKFDFMINKAREDQKGHDLTFAAGGAGLTIHFNDKPDDRAVASLQDHCERRKYSQKANSWFGLCISPTTDPGLRFGLTLDSPWEESPEMEAVFQGFDKRLKSKRVRHSRRKRRAMKKVGRNEPCPCRSGKKYKKCCL